MDGKRIDILLAWGNFFMLSFFGTMATLYNELQKPKPVVGFIVTLIMGVLFCLSMMTMIFIHAEKIRK
jgi:hypothetical protein